MATIGSIRPIDSTFICEINDFPNQCQKVGDCIYSPYFQAGDIPLDDTEWYLMLYPFGDEVESENHLSIYLCCNFNTYENIELETYYSLSLWNDKFINFYSTVEKDTFTKTDCNWGYPKFLLRSGDKLKNYLNLSEDSTLRIRCSIRSLSLRKICNLKNKVTEHIETLLSDENFSDLTIEVGNKKLKAHKAIMAARSEVFSAMFKHDMKENNENVVKIDDISYNVMKEILRFIYCGEVEQLDSLSKDLLVAADKYNLALLKEICEQNLWKNLNTNNVCDILNISNLYNCAKLKEVAIKLIIKNMKTLVDTEEFKKISANSKLCYDIFKEISFKKN